MPDLQPLPASTFRRLFESSPHPYLILRADSGFTIVAVNDRYLAATGTEREAIVGRGLFEVFPDNPDDHSGSGVGDLRTSLQRVMRDRMQDIMGVQKYDIPRSGGAAEEGFEVRYWSPVNTPVLEPDGNIAYIIHHVEDVTDFILSREQASRESAAHIENVMQRAERMEAEVLHRATEVKSANRKLKAAMEELERREVEMARLNARLQELDHAKTEFFANISHEFRTPLTLMLGPLEDLLERVSSHSDVDKLTLLEIAYRNALRLLKLVNTLLDFSRIEAGRTQPNWQAIDLAAYTAELASNFQSLYERADLAFVVDCPPLPRPVEVDPDMWEKIVLNLLSNAFKFTFHGSIEVHLHAVDDEVELAVVDTGIGIPKQELPHLFERFHRVEHARGRTYEGSGIGLALVRDLVLLHEGSIGVESDEGRGSRFSIRIPMGVAHTNAGAIDATATSASSHALAHAFVEEAMQWLPEAASTGPSDQALPAGKRYRIVVVDDNADMRAYIRRLLEEAGYAVTGVANAEAALEACQPVLPDLILSDIMMPGMDGFALLRQIRANRDTANLPVILLSARAGEEARIEGLSAGADDYLTKPFLARELVARVENMIRLTQVRRKLAEMKMTHLAHHDPLTGLPNRLLFSVSLGQAMEKAKRQSHKIGMFLLDLDRFKLVNDTLGHAVGDQLLQVVAQRLQQCVRAEDTVARLGGDEFAIIVNELADTQDVLPLIRKIIQSVAEPVYLSGKEIVTSISIGISTYPDDATTTGDLFKAADAAMYRAKACGRNTYDFYTAEIASEADRHLALETGLRRALACGEFELYYQPQIALDSGRIVGVEALLRWHDPKRGLILPDEFIHVAEESGLIDAVSDWVLQAALVQAAAWSTQKLAPLRVAVNLSGRQILHDHIDQTISEALQRHPPLAQGMTLQLEITESILLSFERCADAFQRLKKHGMTIAIDDFGTGYSSLSRLKHLAVDTLKIDKAFINDIPAAADNTAITIAVITMAHGLGLKVVAEGVETAKQLAFLREHACDEAQGFAISEALDAQAMTALLRTGIPHYTARPRQ